ncbi:hypothetical protein BDV25DRAFT_148475 [Aspergillus avenaceus]|uniref:Uncharacterized protein n=1 Tax=Aspergillus avenaceus TaxID=36643 RepID=A0A5N6U5U4_ASPAV|nr:hypothetical protein BDV25DRAFT_148475 [Aspergillus avenaceus]
MRYNRWTPVKEFPLTGLLTKCFPASSKKRATSKAEIVSEKLCDHVLQRLEPFLLRNRPVDILDLWPGAGLWSAKVNEYLRPQRHVLVEPDLQTFKPLLQKLTKNDPSFELVEMDLKSIYETENLLPHLFPNQGPQNTDTTGSLAKNHTLLVLANPPASGSKKDHYTPARWWSTFMENCMRQSGVHSYGSVRLIASLPISDAQLALPRTLVDRKRPGLLTENVALHAFEVAGPRDPSPWVNFKGWHTCADIAEKVALRAQENNIQTPDYRRLPPVTPAPRSPDMGRLPVPYAPRACTDFHERLINVINDEKRTSADLAATNTRAKRDPRRMRALIQLNKDNRLSYLRQKLTESYIDMDEQHRILSRAAADPEADVSVVQGITSKIDALQPKIEVAMSEIHYEPQKLFFINVDEKRSTAWSDSLNHPVLLWDQRPFEPLLIHANELYPREVNRSILYFEADTDPRPLKKLHRLTPKERDIPIRLFEALSFTIATRTKFTVTELFQLLFPQRPINDVVKAIPILAFFARKTVKPEFASLSKAIHGPPGADSKDLDPAACYQENLDYDLSDVRLRSLPSTILWDICLEYEKADVELNAVQLSRLLGGTLTSWRTGDYMVQVKQYH